MDVLLLDGDHNWYTVTRELEAAEGKASRYGTPPLVLLHDTDWPYGKRDAYWDPAEIPSEFLQPHAAGGLVPGLPDLQKERGIDRLLVHARTEGGERNGVRTAAEDFLSAHGGWALRLIPGMYGTAVLAPDALLARFPPLKEFLDALEVSGTLLERMEEERLRRETEAVERAYDLCELETQIMEGRQTLHGVHVRIQELEAEALSLRETAASAQRENVRLAGDIARVTEELRETARDLTRTTDDLRREREELLRVKSTRSWRITEPLRRAEKLLRSSGRAPRT